MQGQLGVLVSCGVGICLLGLLNSFALQTCSLPPRENDMLMDLTSRVMKRKHQLVSVVLLQRWWKLELFRRRKSPNLQAVFALHEQLSTHRAVPLKSLNINFIRLERQIRLCQIQLFYKMRQTKERLTPLLNIQALVDFT